jgi:hypothetical protein
MEIRSGGMPLQAVQAELDELIAKLGVAPVRAMEPPADLQLELFMIDAYQRHCAKTGFAPPWSRTVTHRARPRRIPASLSAWSLRAVWISSG